MDEFAKMDIFFVVTTVTVVIVLILLVAVLYRVWRILGYVQHFTEELREETELVREDIAHLRQHVRTGFRMSKVARFWRSVRKEVEKDKKS